LTSHKIICRGEILKDSDANSVGHENKKMSRFMKHKLILKSEDHLHIKMNENACMSIINLPLNIIFQYCTLNYSSRSQTSEMELTGEEEVSRETLG
jgi:hypothetical protein